jgi:D-3-phosphoglycerate dehydrogenase
MTRVAVSSRSFSRNALLRAELSARYPDTTFNESGRSLSGDELVRFLAGHERVITALEVLDEAILNALPDLAVVAKYGVGVDTIDIPALARRGIRLGWTGGVNRRSVAELVIAFSIALLRHVPRVSAELRRGTWHQGGGRLLSGRTVGIVGCGHVGKDVVRLLAGFDCRILVHDLRDFSEFYRKYDIESVGLDDLLERAEVVTLHLPLDASTRGMFDARRLALMRSDAILINTARGDIVDELALEKMLREGRLAGAAFDVFRCEPPDNASLLSLPNFLATPHIGGSAEEAILAMGRAAIHGLDQNKVPEPGDECWPRVLP